MTQGDFVRVDGKANIEQRLEFIRRRLYEWDYETPAVIRLEKYVSHSSDNQMRLVHVWFRKMTQFFNRKLAQKLTEEMMKDLMKHMFLSSTVIVGKTECYKVKSLKDLDMGEMQYFMDQVYNYATEYRCRLPIPEHSEYKQLRDVQNA